MLPLDWDLGLQSEGVSRARQWRVWTTANGIPPIPRMTDRATPLRTRARGPGRRGPAAFPANCECDGKPPPAALAPVSAQGTCSSSSRFACRKAVRGQEDAVTGFLWIVLIGLIAGVIARFVLPGPNNPQGFVLTTVLGIAGALVATWIGQTIGWYRPDQGAGIISATLGALIVLVVWHRLVVQRVVSDPGVSRSNWPPSRP
jgi:uncharacterized membrane protein YeaQ/YmgE (transglycosylase-associated protein family)